MDPVSQRFLELAYESGRLSVNGITISRQMGLSHRDYIGMIGRLHETGYVHAPGSNAKDVMLTEAGIRQAKSTAPR